MVDALVDLALAEDLSGGDATTAACGVAGQAVGCLTARQPLIFCGAAIAWRVIRRAGVSIDLALDVDDGQRVEGGQALARLEGSLVEILAVERTLLNFLQRLCGVATLTRKYVDAVAGTRARITDTRKTVPGWRTLDKLAVRAGGGSNHRQDLSSGILIKDNHLMATAVGEAVRRARERAPHSLRVEVEVDTLTQLEEALSAGAELVLLDNMSPEEVERAVSINNGRALLEVSGGVVLETVRAYAEAGADLISVGALTHSAPAADIALDIAHVDSSR
ncbi:MAG: carboxylating nicotinate-nucleotide diphosphorylase [Deltaproteobacteria bacterium]|nr:carboxylating nicotinate-nucleotide diphosphorylase [Deltaproteobacteria bacterium]